LVQRPGRSLDSDRQTDRQLDKYILDYYSAISRLKDV
jgi:hypothetical protein